MPMVAPIKTITAAITAMMSFLEARGVVELSALVDKIGGVAVEGAEKSGVPVVLPVGGGFTPDFGL